MYISIYFNKMNILFIDKNEIECYENERNTDFTHNMKNLLTSAEKLF